MYKTRVRICPLATAVKVKAVGPSITKIGPLKYVTGVTITDQRKQLDTWAEHYQQLYSRETIVTETAFHNTTPLAEVKDLDIPSSTEDLSKAIDTLAYGKAPGNDGIPQKSSRSRRQALSQTICMSYCYSAGVKGWYPRMCETLISSHCIKNKGDRSDCNSYRGFSLVSIVGKVFARVALNRLQSLAERVYTVRVQSRRIINR